nr:EOG090X0B7I [Eulimnadia texana]
MDAASYHYGGPESHIIEELISQIKSQGIFDQWRKDCFADVDTKPAYQNLKQRVESSVRSFLDRKHWRPDLIKNQVRENLRRHILDLGFIERGVDRIVEQVVKPKILPLFRPAVEAAVYKHYGVEKPSEIKNEEVEEKKDDVEVKKEDVEEKEKTAEAPKPELPTADREDKPENVKRVFKPLPVVISAHAEEGTPPPGEESSEEDYSQLIKTNDSVGQRESQNDDVEIEQSLSEQKEDTADGKMEVQDEKLNLEQENAGKSPGLSSIHSEEDVALKDASPVSSDVDDFVSPAFEKIEINLKNEAEESTEKTEEVEDDHGQFHKKDEQSPEPKPDGDDNQQSRKTKGATESAVNAGVTSAKDADSGKLKEESKSRERSRKDKKRDREREKSRSSRKSDSREKERSHKSKSDRRDQNKTNRRSESSFVETTPHKPKIWDYIASLPSEYFDADLEGSLSDVSTSSASSYDKSDFEGSAFIVLSEVEVDESLENYLKMTEARILPVDSGSQVSPPQVSTEAKRLRKVNSRYSDSYLGPDLTKVENMLNENNNVEAEKKKMEALNEDLCLSSEEEGSSSAKRIKIEGAERLEPSMKPEENGNIVLKENPNKPKRQISTKQPTQRYDSDDLYKPRPSITPSSRRFRSSQNTP